MSNEENITSNTGKDQGFVFIANEILRKCKINGEVQSLEECSDSFFVAVYEGILGESLEGVVSKAVSHKQRISNCDKVIEALSHDVLNVDLSHITGANILDGDLITIQNLLEIFKELLDFILDGDDVPDEKNDSNLLSSDHEVISDVLQQEFGQFSQATFTLNPQLEDALSCDGSPIEEPEVSSIPKCSDILKNSDAESASTDEIIRESELLEHQLVRDYPSLRQSRDQGKFEQQKTCLKSEELSGHFCEEKLAEEKQKLNGKGTIGSISVPKDTARDTHVLKGDEYVPKDAVRNSEILEGTIRDACVPVDTIRGTQVHKARRRLGNESEAHKLEVGTLRRPLVIPTGSAGQVDTVQNSGGFIKGAARDVDGSLDGQESSNYCYRDVAHNPGVATKFGKSKEVLRDVEGSVDHETDKLQPLLGEKKGGPNVGIKAGENYRNRLLGSTGLGQENRKQFSRWRTQDNGGEAKRYEKRNDKQKRRKNAKLGLEEDFRKDEPKTIRCKDGKSADGCNTTSESVTADLTSSQKTSRLSQKIVSEHSPGRDVIKGNQGSVRARINGMNWGASRGNSENHGVARKGKEDIKGSQAVTMDQVGSLGTRDQKGSSDASGVFWDDQVSPLDVSERLHNPDQGVAFDEIGQSQKSSARQGLGRSKESPVVRHYHHHYHHGSSEDLIRDVDLREKAQHFNHDFNKQMAGSRNVQGLGHRELIRKETSPTKEGQTKGNGVKKRSVKFDDHVDTRLITNRLERLRREMELEDERENEQRSHIRHGYDGYLSRLKKEHRKMERELKQQPKKSNRLSPYRKKRSHVQVTYGKTANQRRARYPSTKARKRSTSASPKNQHKRKAAKQLEKGDIILPTLLDEFPYLHLSPHTLQTMRHKQTRQLTSLSKSALADKRLTETQKALEDAEKRQQTLLKILRKDLQHNQRMREQKERKEQERAVKSKLREKRQASARARRYYEDYQLRMRARMLKRRTKEEQVFKNLFEDGLEIQKQRVRELRNYAKEQREMRAVKQQNELESLENYYRDQYSVLAEAIAQEKEALLTREKAQEKVIHQMQRNLREKLRKEVTDIQETLVRDEDDAYFRRLDADRLRRQLQMTAFQNLS